MGGIPKIVHDEENGYCCKAGDTDVMSEAITDLLMDQLKREKMAEDSISIVKAKYSLEAHISCMEDVYEKVMT